VCLDTGDALALKARQFTLDPDIYKTLVDWLELMLSVLHGPRSLGVRT
jgi:hypothetical protein